jgi:phosphoribosylanthranilate isomerase
MRKRRCAGWWTLEGGAMVVKVCGITNREDGEAALAQGATALGFNFWPGSPRYVDPEMAREFAPSLDTLRVGVFVNAPAGEVARAAEAAKLHVAQLHGTSSAPGGLAIWRAVAVKDDFRAELLDDPAAEAFLLDAPAGALHGGTGRTFDWNLVRGAGRRIILAGGLDGSNVARAIETAHPWGVDACSRIESSPGKKDHEKMAAFVRAALAASRIS